MGNRACPGTHLEPGIKFTTFHTAKGLEFHYVIIADFVNPDLHDRLGDEFDWDLERRLLYIAMTRAMIHIQMYTYEGDTKLLKELDSLFYDRRHCPLSKQNPNQRTLIRGLYMLIKIVALVLKLF